MVPGGAITSRTLVSYVRSSPRSRKSSLGHRRKEPVLDPRSHLSIIHQPPPACTVSPAKLQKYHKRLESSELDLFAAHSRVGEASCTVVSEQQCTVVNDYGLRWTPQTRATEGRERTGVGPEQAPRVDDSSGEEGASVCPSPEYPRRFAGDPRAEVVERLYSTRGQPDMCQGR